MKFFATSLTILLFAALAWPQCNTADTLYPNATLPTGVVVVFNGSYLTQCPGGASPTAQGPNAYCAYGPVSSGSFGCTQSICLALLAAMNTTGGGGDYCQWNCGGACGTIRIDGSRGLPVELLELDID